MYINIINSYRTVIAIADADLIGKKFEEKEKQLDIKKTFYQGKETEPKSLEEAETIIKNWKKEDATFNIVGEKSISLALKTNIINNKSIGKIQNIPYALVLL